MDNVIRLKREEEHLETLYSFFDKPIRELILSHLGDSYENQILKEIEDNFTFIEETEYFERVSRILNLIINKFKIEGGVKVYVDEESSSIYAKAYPTTDDKTVNFVVLSKNLIEEISDKELKFILGHEVSHIYFKHAVIRWIIDTIYPEKSKIPPYINNEIELWEQLAELSSDRAGLYICCDKDSAVSALNKIDNIKKPSLKIRTSCLTSQDSVEKFYSRKIDVKGDEYSAEFMDFIEKSCLLLSRADGHISTTEESFILNRLSRYKYLKNDYQFNLDNVALDDLVIHGKIIADKYPKKVKEIFNYLGVLSLKDQKLSKEEYHILKEIGINSFGFSLKELDAYLVSIIRSKFFIPFNEL